MRRGKRALLFYSGDEVYLAHKLAAVERSAQEVLTKVKGLPPEQALAELTKFAYSWSGVTDNSVIERILRYEA